MYEDSECCVCLWSVDDHVMSYTSAGTRGASVGQGFSFISLTHFYSWPESGVFGSRLRITRLTLLLFQFKVL